MSFDSSLDDVFVEDEDRRKRAIVALVSSGTDPEPLLDRIGQLELITDPTGLFKGTTQETPLNTLALTYREHGFLQYARKILEALTNHGSTNPATLNNLGLVLYQLGDVDKAEKLFRQAYDLDRKLNPEKAAVLPAARNLRGIEPEMKAARNVRTIAYIIWLASVVAILFVTFFAARVWTQDPNDFLTNLLQVDGFLYAFVGTFSVFVLTGIQSRSIRNACLIYVVGPLLVLVSLSISSALVLVLVRWDSVLVLVPYILMIAGLAHTVSLVYLVRLI